MAGAANTKLVSEVPTEEFNALVNKVNTLFDRIHPENELLTSDQVATMIKRSVHTVRKIKSLIGFVKTDNDILFRKSDVDAYIMRHYHAPTNKTSQVAVKRVARS